MCLVSDKVKFCTCVTGSFKKLPNYWVLYRFDKQKNLMYLGEPLIPYDFLQSNYKLNGEILAKRLNELDAFDKEIEFKPNDQLEIVINNLTQDEKRRITYGFEYKNGKWVEGEFDTFESMNGFNVFAHGNIDQLYRV